MISPDDSSRVIGRYTLFGEIAAGGMATVHFGQLNGLVGFSRTVAIKRLHAQFAKDPEFVTMFLDEAHVAGRIRHPNVVSTLDVVATEGEVFLVMEYVQGESLARLLRTLHAKRQRIPPDICVAILAGMLHGLHAAHEATDKEGLPLNIVHRDVSPQNVLVGIDGVPRVLDFGVAKAAGRTQTTRAGQLKGKLAYMAPEQLRGGPVTRQADVYAAGIVLWEIVTGERLFEGDSEAMILAKALEGKVVPPSRIVPGLTATFDHVVVRGIAQDPAARFDSAREMAIALEKCCRMAPPREVGEWVESLAGEQLTKRAVRVAQIERSSVSRESVTKQAGARTPHTSNAWGIDALPAPRMAPIATPAGDVVAESSPSRTSALPLDDVPAPPMHRSRAGLLLAVALVMGLVGVFLIIVGVRRTPSKVAAGVTPPTITSPTETPAAVDASTVTEPVAARAPAPPQPDQALSAAPQTATSQQIPMRVTGAPARSRLMPPPHPSTPPRPPPIDCDPPFTIDVFGHKKFKAECMAK